MRNYICLVALMVAVSGCALNQERIDANVSTLQKESRYGYETVLDMPYKEAFKLVVDVFRNDGISILKRDYENKLIFGCGDKHPALLMDTFLVLFEEQGLDKTKLIIKGAKGHRLLADIEAEVEYLKREK